MRRVIGCALGIAVVAALLALRHAHAGDNGTKPDPADIQPVRMIADPYPAFNGIAVDPANGLVVLSDPNRKSLLTYDRLRGASQGSAKRAGPPGDRAGDFSGNDCRGRCGPAASRSLYRK